MLLVLMEAKMFTLATPFASLSYRVVTDDDLEDADDAAAVGGIVITGLQSIKPVKLASC
jgi:hypothetical protein